MSCRFEQSETGMSEHALQDLEQSILARSRHRGIHVDLEKIRYSIHELYKSVPAHLRRKALYVGVGHGQDALMALLDNLVISVVGVDPYQGGGNDEEDFRDLLGLIHTYKLSDHFLVHKGTIEDYLQQGGESVSMVMCCDVLHHIFETDQPLNQSGCFEAAVNLFREMYQACEKDGMLVISDVQRDGFRPFMAKQGWLKTPVNYRTKQNWQQWHSAAIEAGWKLKHREVYIPFAFQKLGWLFRNPLGLFTLCDRYFLYYEKTV